MADQNIPAAPDGTAAIPVNNSIPPAPDGTQAVPVSNDSAQSAPSLSDKLGQVADQPLTSYTEATRAGAASAAQGVVQGVQGIASAVAHPIDTVKSLASAPGNLVDQIKQVPGAIKDINASPDPTGVYAKVAQKTLGNVGGQVLAGAATEGLASAAGKAGAAVGKLSPKLADAVGGALDTVKGKNIAAAEAEHTPLVDQATQAVSQAKAATTGADMAAAKTAAEAHPSVLSQKVMGTLQKTASKEGFTITTATPREAVPELAGQFKDRAQIVYRTVDKAVGGEFQPVLDGIQETRQAIKTNSALDPAKATALRKDLVALEKTKATLLEEAAAKGVPDAQKAIAVADKDYAQYKALDSMGKQVKTASGEVRTGGLPDPRKFASAIDRLNDTGKLQRGPQELAELKQHASEALDRLSQAKEAEGLSKDAAKTLSGAQRDLTKAQTAKELAVEKAKTVTSKARWKAISTGAGTVGLTYGGTLVKDVLSGNKKE